MTRFADLLWNDVADLRRRIIELPFNRELAAGTLERPRFQFYILQDSIYLDSYSRALAVAAAKAPEREAMLTFAGSATGAVTVEQALHESYFAQFGLSNENVAGAEPSPTCLGYTGFLLGLAATAPYEELIAGLLPCFWVYWEVGTHIAERAREDNPYRAWIDTYADEEFAEATRAAINALNRAGDGTTAAVRDRMTAAFKRSTQYEWMFWDSAYRMEDWPVRV